MTSTMKKAAVIGYPISQSLSPFIHNHWFNQTGISGIYTAVEVTPETFDTDINTFIKKGFSGFNVTVPHKVSAFKRMDKLAPLARQMGAVNTVRINEDGTLTGFNTDGIGLVTHLKKTVPDYVKDRPALILGAGGAARAAILGMLGEAVPFVMLCNRTREKAEAVAEDIGRDRVTVVDWGDRNSAASAAGVIINTTVLGMGKNPPLDIDLSACASDTTLYDIVYDPLDTPLLKNARRAGLRTVDGLGMLVYQAAAAFKIWFGAEVGFDDALKEMLETKIREKQKADT